MKRRLQQLSAALCIALTLTSVIPANFVFAATAAKEDVIFAEDGADDPVLPDGSETPDEPQPDQKPEEPAVKKSTVKKAWIVAKKKARVNWTRRIRKSGRRWRRFTGKDRPTGMIQRLQKTLTITR